MATKEQIRSRVTFLNSVASGSVVAAGITPAIGLSIGTISIASDRFWWVVTGCAFWVAVAVILHDLAYRTAGKID